MKIDREIDFHGFTVAQMRAWLETTWARRQWHGLRRVRVIHGTGAVLFRELRRWCDEKGIPWTTEIHNPGVTILHPSHRALPSPPSTHHPFAALKHRLSSRAAPTPRPSPPKKRPTPPAVPASPSKPDPDAARLMEEEFDRLAEVDPETLYRWKHARK